MTIALPGDAHGRIAACGLRRSSPKPPPKPPSWPAGRGWVARDELVELVGWLYQNLPQPMVVDADALNALAQRPDVLAQARRPANPHAASGRILPA